MTGMKRRLAALLACMVLFSCAAAPAEDIGLHTVDIQESLVSREGQEDRTLEEHLLQILELLQRKEVRNLLKIEDVSLIASEVIWNVLVWMWDNRPVTMKILAELGIGETDLRNVDKLWDSAERLSSALEEHSKSEQGQRLEAEIHALAADEEFRKSLNSLADLMTSEDLGNLLASLQEAAESGSTALSDGPLTAAALERELDRASFTGSLLLSLLNVLDQSEWARETLPGLLFNENLWRLLLDAAQGSEELDRIFREEFTLLTSDPEMNSFLQRTLYAVFNLMNAMQVPGSGSGEDENRPQEETEVPAP